MVSFLGGVRRGVFFLLVVAATMSPAFGQKKWTLLVFLNGNNNLDEYGELNINQLESLGSNEDFDLVVQYASARATTTKRYHIAKDADMKKIMSPVVEEIPRVDMGKASSLVEFAKWGMEKFPAEHYFIDVWNHGSGWKRNRPDLVRAISHDDFSNNKITTVQFGQALKEIADHLGRKVDVVGADACLMAMAEVASELQAGAEYFVGSEEVEPADGWPYHQWFGGWMQTPGISTVEALQILTKEYVKYYDAGTGWMKRTVGLSAMDLTKMGELEAAMKDFAKDMTAEASSTYADAFKAAMKETTTFYYSDYADLGHLVANLRSRLPNLTPTLEKLDAAVKAVVVANNANGAFLNKVQGIAIWVPKYSYQMSAELQTAYSELSFDKATNWLSALKALVPQD